MFQELLSTLNRIAQKYNVNIANVATRYILDKPAVAGVIIGVRLGIVDHRSSNMQVFNFSLNNSDYDDIDVPLWSPGPVPLLMIMQKGNGV